MAQIKEVIVESNTWWKVALDIDYKDREVYANIHKFLSTRQIIALTGLRRVGKTTLMLKMVKDLIAMDVEPQRILYFSFDEFKTIEIRDVLAAYVELTETDLRQGNYFMLLDEIQKLDNWHEQLKRVYDTYKNLKIIISGSESLFIRKKSRESLAGRMFEFTIKPLTFQEFLAFKGTKYKPLSLYEKELQSLFNEFIKISGFPELVGITDRDIITKYIHETVIEKIIYRDIPTIVSIRNTSILASLFNIIFENPGQLIEINALANEMNISRNVLSSYLRYLEESYLIVKLYNFSRNSRKSTRKLKKYYPAIFNAAAFFKDDELTKSKIFENVIVVQLYSQFFWRDAYKNEVDIILADDPIIPIEVKYGQIETQGLLRCMKKFGLKKGIVVSRSYEKTIVRNGKTVHVVPAYKFLLNKESIVKRF